jgi:putative heme iron utilization protein
MSDVGTVSIDHDMPEPFRQPPPPLAAGAPARRRTAAEEARTLVGSASVGALATLSSDGHPWSSLVTYGVLHDGSPVFLLSHLAEHGRNLERDRRASLMVAEPGTNREPLAHGRVTLVGRAERAAGELADRAREAHVEAVPTASAYAEFGDFSLWVMGVERVRWVGGYGRMDSADPAAYAGAEVDPTAVVARRAIEHLNDDHADALLEIARALGGYPDAIAVSCTRIDRYGLELSVETPRGQAPTRVAYLEPVGDAAGLRGATVELARRARGDAR